MPFLIVFSAMIRPWNLGFFPPMLNSIHFIVAELFSSLFIFFFFSLSFWNIDESDDEKERAEKHGKEKRSSV